MPKATHSCPDEDDFTITVERPAGTTDAIWDAIKRQLAASCTPVVSDILGNCLERPWCKQAGTPDHGDFHASRTVDLVPAHAQGELAAVSAWLVEPRGGGSVQLVIDGSGQFAGARRECEIDARDAALLLSVAAHGALFRNELDATTKLIDLLAEVPGLEEAGR